MLVELTWKAMHDSETAFDEEIDNTFAHGWWSWNFDLGINEIKGLALMSLLCHLVV